MSGTNVLPVKTVATNSDFSVVSRTDKSAESTVALVGADRQVLAAEGKNLPAETQEKEAVSKEAVTAAVKSLADSTQHMARKLEFSVNEPSGKVVVTVFDKTSEEVIRQIPGERAIAIAEHIASLTEDEPILGLLLDSQA